MEDIDKNKHCIRRTVEASLNDSHRKPFMVNVLFGANTAQCKINSCEVNEGKGQSVRVVLISLVCLFSSMFPANRPQADYNLLCVSQASNQIYLSSRFLTTVDQSAVH